MRRWQLSSGWTLTKRVRAVLGRKTAHQRKLSSSDAVARQRPDVYEAFPLAEVVTAQCQRYKCRPTVLDDRPCIATERQVCRDAA